MSLWTDDDDDERDHAVVLNDVPWSVYVRLADARGEKSVPRISYLDGVLEIVSPGPNHEGDKKLIARLVEAYADESGVALNGLGSITYRKKAKKGGLEPDECYYVGKVKGFPHLAIEIVKTHGGVDKLEIYRRLGVREVWFWAKGKLHVFELGADGAYRTREGSGVLPTLNLTRLAELVTFTSQDDQAATVRRWRAEVRATH